MQDLPAKHELFAKEYLIDMNGTNAAIRAGYAPNSAHVAASRLLKNDKVSSRIKQLLAEKTEELDISAKYVLETIKETVERCRQHAPVLDKKGEQVLVETEEGELSAAFQFQPIAVMKGCELLGKHLKLFTDKVEHTGKDGEDLIPPSNDIEIARRVAFILSGAEGCH